MTTDWLEATTAGSLTREQVAAAGLPAWSAATSTGDTPFYFDGVDFLRRALWGDRRPVAASAVPETGWRHGSGCRCAACSGAAQSSLA